jgi:hypothetical protein
MSDQNQNQNQQQQQSGQKPDGGSRDQRRDARPDVRNAAPVAQADGKSLKSRITELWNSRRPKNLFKGGGPLNFNAPGQPDHWLENAIEFVGRTIMMFGLTMYPLLLIYAAAVAFVPRQANPMWFGPLSWNDVLAFIVTIAVNGAYYQIKRRNKVSRGNYPADLLAILGLKTVLILFGLTYSFFQNPWSADPSPFAMPATAAMVFNPIFLGLVALIVIDTWKPSFLRDKVMFDDENLPASKSK